MSKYDQYDDRDPKWRKIEVPVGLLVLPLIVSFLFGTIVGIIITPNDPNYTPLYERFDQIDSNINGLYEVLQTPVPTQEPTPTVEPTVVPTPIITPVPTVAPTPEPTCEWVPLETPADTPGPNDIPPCDWTPK